MSDDKENKLNKRKWMSCIKLLCVLLFLCVMTDLIANEDDTNKIGMSKTLIERNILKTQSEIDDIKVKITNVDDVITQAKQVKNDIEGVALNWNKIKDELSEIKADLTSFKGKVVLSAGEIRRFRNQHGSFFYRYNTDVKNIYYRFSSSYLNQSHFYSNKELGKDSLLYGYRRTVKKIQRFEDRDDIFGDKHQNLESVISYFDDLRLNSDNENTSHDIEQVAIKLPDALKELESMNESFFEALLKSYVKKLTSYLQDEVIKQLELRKKTLEDSYLELKKVLSSHEKKMFALQAGNEKRSTTYLDESVPIMLWGILGILVFLVGAGVYEIKVRGSDNSQNGNSILRHAIEKRIFIEILSMGFLLLVILMLGAGGKVDAQILGTLLGTIAGYIFGRGTTTKQ